MDKIIEEYKLPDLELRNDKDSEYRYLIWQPQKMAVILGKSNHVEDAVFLENCLNDNITILKRPTGGQSVVISNNMLAISILKGGTTQLPSQDYFCIYNKKIMTALGHLGIDSLEHKGISDITLNGKKIAGTALYRNRQQVFYHAILNIKEEPEILERYLKFPIKSPEYRKNRSHRDFVTSIVNQGYDFSLEKIKLQINNELAKGF